MPLIRRPAMTPYTHVRLKQISMARVVRRYTRVCLAYVCLELTHEKKMDTYLGKKPTGQKRLHVYMAKNPHVYRYIFLNKWPTIEI